MPIYEYLCESCGKVNEQLQKVGDPPPPRCDECGSRKLAKLVSRSAFQLKGGGWYSDLYATAKKKGAKPADGAGDAPAATADPKTESAPVATKAPPAPAKGATTPGGDGKKPGEKAG